MTEDIAFSLEIPFVGLLPSSLTLFFLHDSGYSIFLPCRDAPPAAPAFTTLA